MSENKPNVEMPKWLTLNSMIKTKDEKGNFKLEKDIEAARSFFVDNINHRMVFFHDLKEKLDFLIENDYYKKTLYENYRFEDIKEIFKFVYSYKFRFKSYMAAQKFYEKYALRTNDQKMFLERYEDRIAVVALDKAKGDIRLAKKYAKTMIIQGFQPATPIVLSSGRARAGKEVSCFIVHTNDSTEGIMYVDNAAAQLSRMGGAIGVNLTDLRSINDPIKQVENAAGGPIGVAKKVEHTVSYFDQLGQRDGSAAVYLSAMHYDIETFLSTKKINADENERLKSVSLGVLVPDIVFRKAIADEIMYVFSPYHIEKEYGVKLSEINIDDYYEDFIMNPNIKKRQVNARKLLTNIAGTQQESGYPYLIYIDNANKQHHLKAVGKIKCSNLCVEIFQLQLPSKIEGYGSPDSEWGTDVSCVLGSNNVVTMMETGEFEEIMEVSVRMLNAVVDDNMIHEVPTVKKGNELFKAIGIGDLNLHGFLAKNGIKYGNTKLTIDFVRTYYATKRYWAIYWSMQMAKETGEKFYGFEESEYYTGEVFTQYIENSFEPKTDKIKKLFENIKIPTQEDWEKLSKDVKKYGIRNAYLMAIAPTGSISYIQNATASVLPIAEIIETRPYGDSQTYYPVPYLKEAFFTYMNDTAYDISPFKIIDVIAEIQKHVDQGISTTLFIPSTADTAYISQVYTYGWLKGLKSIYYLRTKLVDETGQVIGGDGENCIACEV